MKYTLLPWLIYSGWIFVLMKINFLRSVKWHLQSIFLKLDPSCSRIKYKGVKELILIRLHSIDFKYPIIWILRWIKLSDILEKCFKLCPMNESCINTYTYSYTIWFYICISINVIKPFLLFLHRFVHLIFKQHAYISI